MTTRSCNYCGAPVEVEVPPNLGVFRELAERVSSVCAACRKRAERERQDRELAAQHQRELAIERDQGRRADCGIPEQLRGLTWKRVAPTSRPDVVDAAELWEIGMVSGLVLTGPVGVGKTWIAAAAAWARLAYGPLSWFSAPVLLAHLSLPFDNELHQRAILALSDSCSGALVLDDVDKVRPTEYGAEQIFCAIDNRLTAGEPLLVTSNLELSLLSARWPQPHGEAIASRLAGHCESFALEGPDRRFEQWAS